VQPLLEQVLKQYPNEVKLVYKNFPLPQIHKFGQKAAVAALAAGEQGKYWEYHDLLYNDYKNINDDRITEIATSLDLDMEKFFMDMANQELTDLVNADYQEGLSVGVRGTPTIFINGRLLKQRNLNGFMVTIDNELRKAGVKQ
jgi:protein-disulfide isomerase